MDNQHFQWEKSQYKGTFSIANCYKLQEAQDDEQQPLQPILRHLFQGSKGEDGVWQPGDGRRSAGLKFRCFRRRTWVFYEGKT